MSAHVLRLCAILAAVCSSFVAAQGPSPAATSRTFGTGVSSGKINTTERVIFTNELDAGDTGVMTHFWITGGASVDGAIVRYYVDGESKPSIEFVPSLACGVGFDDQQAPWGTKWLGKGAKSGSWFHNYRIPFGNSIRITLQLVEGSDVFWMIVRGASNIDIRVGDFVIPSGARMTLQKTNVSAQPLERINVVDVPSGSGLVFMHTLAVSSGNLNFLEGCYHLYTPYTAAYPGVLLSTGTEDYFDSAFYFNAGQFHLDVAGLTHVNTSAPSSVTLSAYRFHEMDPILFSNGVKMVWRNGDTVNPSTGEKCFMETGGTVVGHPTVSQVVAYSWIYTW